MESSEAWENLRPLRRCTGQNIQKNRCQSEWISSGYYRDHADAEETGTGHHGASGKGQTGEFVKKRISFPYVS